MKIGDVLKQARLEKGLTINQVAKDIFVQEKYLRALEEGEYDLIPGEAYQRAYFRTYAEYLGLTKYIEDLTRPHKFSSDEEEQAVSEEIFGGRWDNQRTIRVALKLAIIILIPVLIIVGVAKARTTRVPDRRQPNRVQSTQPSGNLQVVPLEDGPTWRVPNDAGSTSNSGGVLSDSGHELKITTTGQCWVEVQTRDGFLIRRVMVAGESQTFHDLIGFYIVAGMPTKCQITFDSQPVTWEEGQSRIVLPPGAAVLPEQPAVPAPVESPVSAGNTERTSGE